LDPNNLKVGVIDTADINSDNNGVDDDNDTPKGIDLDLGPYWTLAQSAQAYVSGTTTSYSNIEASKSTPQYGFNRGLKEFGALGYEATIKELDDNLLGMGAVEMVKPPDVPKSIRYKAMNYLMFLKRKRCGKIKARGCADGRPQREYITKDELSSPIIYICADDIMSDGRHRGKESCHLRHPWSVPTSRLASGPGLTSQI
jgi:hypothetical protein